MSEIFDRYAEIALEKEIITKEAKEEPSSRYSKEEINAIEVLYGVKPNGALDDKHIVEQAHPESVVIAPAYDRVNGLVENLLERQDIMAWIALKPNDGKLLHRRYVKASQDLINELVRVASVLDFGKQEELMVLADNCSGRLNKVGFAIPWVAIIAYSAIASTLYGTASNNIAVSHGVMNDAQDVLNEFEDIFEEWPTARKDFKEPLDKIKKVKKFASNISRIRASIRDLMDGIKKSPAGLEDGIQFLEGKYDEGLVDYLNSYRELTQDLLNDIPNYKAEALAVPERNKRHTEWYEPEMESRFWDPLKWVKRQVIGYDPDEAALAFDRLTKSLGPEEKAIDELISSYEGLRAYVEEVKKDPAKALSNLKEKAEKRRVPEEIDPMLGAMRGSPDSDDSDTEKELHEFMQKMRSSDSGVEV